MRSPLVLSCVVPLLLCLCWAQPADAKKKKRKKKKTVAVLYFDNNTGNKQYDVLQKGLADMLVTDLSQVSTLQVVEREKLQALLDEMKLQRTKYFNPKTAQKLGKGIGAQYAVTGAFAALDPNIRIDIRLIEVKTAKVIMADKIVGSKDKFFDLEESLVHKFVDGLRAKRSKKPTSIGSIKKFQTLVDYSKAVDSSDKGEYKEASRYLGKVVRSAPGFKLAKARYREALQRLRESKAVRGAALGSDEEKLFQNLTGFVKQDPKELRKKEKAEFFAARVGLINYHLWKLRGLLSYSNNGNVGNVVAAKKGATMKAAKAFFENTNRFVKEMEDNIEYYRDGRIKQVSMRLNQEDRRRGKDLGISSDIGKWSFAEPVRVSLSLAKWTVLGAKPFWLSNDGFTMRPTLAEIEPKYAKRAMKLMARIKEKHLDTNPDENDKADQMGGYVEVLGEILVKLGRKEEAIAHWQGYMEDYPKGEKFKQFEKNVEDMLGISPDSEKLRTQLKACSTDAYQGMHQEIQRLSRSTGNEGLIELLDFVDSCKCDPPMVNVGVYIQVANHAKMAGDCDLFEKIVSRKKRLGVYGQSLDQMKCP